MKNDKLNELVMRAWRRGDSLALQVFGTENRMQEKPTTYVGMDLAKTKDSSLYMQRVGRAKRIGNHTKGPVKFVVQGKLVDFVPSYSKIDRLTGLECRKEINGDWEEIQERMEKSAMGFESIETQPGGGFFGPPEVVEEIIKRQKQSVADWGKLQERMQPIKTAMNVRAQDNETKQKILKECFVAQKDYKVSNNPQHRSSTTDYPYTGTEPKAEKRHKCPKGAVICPVCAPHKVRHAF